VIDIECIGDGDAPMEPARQMAYTEEFRPVRERALMLVIAHGTRKRVYDACYAQREFDPFDLWQACLSVVADSSPGINQAAWESAEAS
jgi:hypothetical protein